VSKAVYLSHRNIIFPYVADSGTLDNLRLPRNLTDVLGQSSQFMDEKTKTQLTHNVTKPAKSRIRWPGTSIGNKIFQNNLSCIVNLYTCTIAPGPDKGFRQFYLVLRHCYVQLYVVI
jgi:hypothetical protein